MRRLSWYLILLAVTILRPPYGVGYAAPAADELATLRAHVIDWFSKDAPPAATIEGFLGSLTPAGSWPDIDYASKERGGWPVYRHLTRTLAMAAAYRQAGHPLAGSTRVRHAIEKALAHWVAKDYRNPNWWYGRIGVPRAVAPLLVMMGEVLPAKLREKATAQILNRSRMGMTGQNKVWCAGIGFLKGLLAGDSSVMRAARDKIFEELRITTREGIQPDYSFHQHGPQQQWGNYGSSFGSDMIQWAAVFRDTTYALQPERLEVLGSYLLEGPTWILWKGRMDISGCGRQNFKGCQSSKGRSLLTQLERLPRVAPAYTEACAQAIACNDPSGVNTLVGHKHYWRSDITVHRRPTWYASVKMSSRRVRGAETCNGENLLGLHLGDGTTFIYRTGTEYEDLMPVWDWRRLPGTTCRQDTGSLVPGSKRCRVDSDFVGGVSDGARGATAMVYVRDGLRAHKAWFFLDQVVVCMGAGITSSGPDPIVTSVDQCVVDGAISVAEEQGVPKAAIGRRTIKGPAWVHHGGRGYAFPLAQNTVVNAQRQHGNWHRVHARYRKRPVEREVFSLWVDHGIRPQQARYVYLVFPDVTAAHMPQRCASPGVAIVEDTPDLMAVSTSDGNLLFAAFFSAGRVTWGSGQTLEADTPCIILLESRGDAAILSVADPTHKRESLKLRLTGHPEVKVALPHGGLAGTTTRVRL